LGGKFHLGVTLKGRAFPSTRYSFQSLTQTKNTMTHKEIVLKLIGEIEPIGVSEIDSLRFENLKAMCNLVNELVADIDEVVKNKNRHEYSMRKLGEYADKFLTDTLGIKND